jgi:hypothetical protein
MTKATQLCVQAPFGGLTAYGQISGGLITEINLGISRKGLKIMLIIV